MRARPGRDDGDDEDGDVRRINSAMGMVFVGKDGVYMMVLEGKLSERRSSGDSQAPAPSSFYQWHFGAYLL